MIYNRQRISVVYCHSLFAETARHKKVVDITTSFQAAKSKLRTKGIMNGSGRKLLKLII